MIFTLLLAFTMQFSFAQEKTVKGVVIGSDGEPIAGATIKVKGTQTGTTTDFDGNYSVKAKEGDVLEISYVGTKSASLKVGVANLYNVTLQADELSVIVVQGYKTVTKEKAVVADATVTSETIENRPNANVMNTLQGQLAGVNVTASTGQPGAKSAVIIRGVGTISGNSDPLYVIDGFPSNSDNFRSINPNDIESSTVLKDAVAIAQYGNRGSNGVIVITTKKAALGEGKTTFRYNSTYGSSYLQTPKYNYANAKELLKIEQTFGAGLGASLTDAEINAYDIDTDWVDYFFRPAITTSHNLSIENRSDNVSSFTSLGYFAQDGLLETTGLKRFTLRNNLNGQSTDKKFKYLVNTSVGYSKNNEATNLGTGAINRNYVTGAFLGAPYLSPDLYQGSQSVVDLFNNTPGLLATPLMLVDKLFTYDNLTEEMRFDVATDFSYKITNNLTAGMRINGQLLQTRFYQAEYPDSFNAILFGGGRAFTGFEDVNNRREFLFNNLMRLSYAKEIGKSSFGADINMEYNHSRLNANNSRQRGLIPGIFVPNTGSGYAADVSTSDFFVPVISTSQLRNDLISYFGSVDYDYDSKYGLVANVRRDGSSRFIDDKQWGTFWSVGGRWNINKEKFMEKLDFINVLKLRGSYGTVGNQRIVDGSIYAGINPPAFTDIYSNANNAYNGGTGYGINFGYPALQWETTTTYNVGFDFEMFSNRLRGAFDLYNRKTEDLFFTNPVTNTSGTTSLTRNTDINITNKGLELNIAYDLIRNDNAKLTLRANASMNDNEVSGIPASSDGQIFTTNASGQTLITQNGGMINEPFVYHYIGVNPDNGNLLFEDANGNPTEAPVAADRRAAGVNNIPKYQGGFGFDFDYKGFFTSTLFTFNYKVSRFDTDYANLFDSGNIGQFVVGTELLNAWTPTNTNTDVPSLNATNVGLDVDSDRFLRDASYIRLRNIQVGYNVPAKYLKNTFMSSVSFMLQGENLFNITSWKGFDPESSRTTDFYQYPTPRLYTFGVDVKF